MLLGYFSIARSCIGSCSPLHGLGRRTNTLRTVDVGKQRSLSSIGMRLNRLCMMTGRTWEKRFCDV